MFQTSFTSIVFVLLEGNQMISLGRVFIGFDHDINPYLESLYYVLSCI